MQEIVDNPLYGLNSYGIKGDDAGYNIVNFTLCWLIGAMIKNYEWNLSRRKCVFLYFNSLIFF